MPLSLLALAVAAFGIGTTEFVVMGLLPDVARDLSVTIPDAGLLVSGYALGVVIGAPLLALLTAKLPRKATLVGAVGRAPPPLTRSSSCRPCCWERSPNNRDRPIASRG